MTTCLFINRFNENISWINNIVEKDFINEIVIFNKGPNDLNFNNKKIKISCVPNNGREGGGYLSYIIDNYINLPDFIFFCQGDSFEHSPYFLNFFF